MLGIRPDYEQLIIDPCIPGDWDGFEAVRGWRGATYEIQVKNPAHVEKGVKTLMFDGKEVTKIPVCEEGSTHRVEVIMG